jgi:hypothetical protein
MIRSHISEAIAATSRCHHVAAQVLRWRSMLATLFAGLCLVGIAYAEPPAKPAPKGGAEEKKGEVRTADLDEFL